MKANTITTIAVGVLLVLVLFSLVVVCYSTRGFGFLFALAEKTETQELTAAGPVNLRVENTYGKVDVVAKETSGIQIEAHYKSWDLTKGIALKKMEWVDLEVTQNGADVSVKAIYPAIPTGVVVDLTMSVPLETSAQVYVTSGELSVRGTRGKTELFTRSGSIQASDIQGGDFSADSGSGSIRIEGVNVGEAPITIENGSGRIDLSHCTGGEITLTNKSGEIVVNKVETENSMRIHSSSGGAIFKDGETGDLSITQNSGAIDISGLKVNGELVLENGSGEIDLKDVRAGSYDLSASSGSIYADGVSGNVVVTNHSGSIKITNGDGAILSLETKSGDIQYNGSLGNGDHQISSASGEIEVNIPADSKIDVFLKTISGSVTTDFEVTVRDVSSENSLSGKINGGGGLLKVTSNSGEIKVNRE